MISLDEYKNYLVNNYNWPMDSSSLLVSKRRDLLREKYSDEFLSRVITDSYSFARSVLNSDTLNSGYFKNYLSEDTTTYVNLGLHGGWMSDTLFIDSQGRYVSKYIIKTIFGMSVIIQLITEEHERETEDGIFTFDYDYFIYMLGFSTNLDLIRESISNTEIKLTKINNKSLK